MHEAIEGILNIIPRGYVFDSHYVITQLIKKESDVYLNFASAINTETNRTLVAHGQIGQEIATFQGVLVESIGREWSENIHGNSSECEAWRKLI
ncbi:MAG: hypothetical protein LHV68_09935 [Elusimicrobia bacterium]|nr:hypothetical protein [Candidatus Liberimonas magnetica]